ncbi:MAG TPA: arginine--tRNA ligase [Chthoniobacteraceae bacterium]|nr:arginine--tRNA ligase [Chthoniobacteraceae bacterium]
MTIASLIQFEVRRAIATRSSASWEPQVTPTNDPRFGDYQTNAAMVLAKQLRTNPRTLAQEIVGQLGAVAEFCEPPEIAGAGFINFRIRPEFLARKVPGLVADARLGVPLPATKKKIVFDFSSPNVAKPMHVGHIRSTILGDSLARIAEFVGHDVVRDNHLGDWGTQFGMLLLGWRTELDRAALHHDPLNEMERVYKAVHARCTADPATREAARHELVKLQGGDTENLEIWSEMIRISQAQFDEIYARLNVRFDFTHGESFYNPLLDETVEELRKTGIAQESEGAWCVFSDGSMPPEEDPFLIKDQQGWRDNPALILKSDGAANYTTTDLATLKYRLATFAPDEIVYVTDGRQQLHFRQLFAIFRRWRPEAAARVRLAHVWFGSILGDDGKPFKTRSGETVRLAELLDEAEERAAKLVAEKNPGLAENERRDIARIIGIGAVKYADLLPNRQTDYVFSWDRMLSLQGNTAPYLQNAYVRIESIFRKAAESGELANGDEQMADCEFELILVEAPERALAMKLLQFGEVVPQVLEDYRPNLLANYLFELANSFHGFYEACPVLKAEKSVRTSRLVLCRCTARVLKIGLQLLGIGVPARM